MTEPEDTGSRGGEVDVALGDGTETPAFAVVEIPGAIPVETDEAPVIPKRVYWEGFNEDGTPVYPVTLPVDPEPVIQDAPMPTKIDPEPVFRAASVAPQPAPEPRREDPPMVVTTRAYGFSPGGRWAAFLEGFPNSAPAYFEVDDPPVLDISHRVFLRARHWDEVSRSYVSPAGLIALDQVRYLQLWDVLARSNPFKPQQEVLFYKKP